MDNEQFNRLCDIAKVTEGMMVLNHHLSPSEEVLIIGMMVAQVALKAKVMDASSIKGLNVYDKVMDAIKGYPRLCEGYIKDNSDHIEELINKVNNRIKEKD